MAQRISDMRSNPQVWAILATIASVLMAGVIIDQIYWSMSLGMMYHMWEWIEGAILVGEISLAVSIAVKISLLGGQPSRWYGGMQGAMAGVVYTMIFVVGYVCIWRSVDTLTRIPLALVILLVVGACSGCTVALWVMSRPLPPPQKTPSAF